MQNIIHSLKTENGQESNRNKCRHRLEYIERQRHWEYEDLKAATGLSDRELNAAIGWLAREDKIDFDMDQNHDRLFLHVNVYIG